VFPERLSSPDETAKKDFPVPKKGESIFVTLHPAYLVKEVNRMDVSAEAADLVVKEGIQATEGAVKLAGSALKNVAALLLALKRQDNKVVGQTNAKRLARDPAPNLVIPLKREDTGVPHFRPFPVAAVQHLSHCSFVNS